MNLFYKWLRVLALVVVPLLVACASTAGEGTVGTSLSGVGHYGGMTGIPNFYVNGQWGGNAPGWGGGGKSLCCVSLPRHPDKPVMVSLNLVFQDLTSAWMKPVHLLSNQIAANTLNLNWQI